MLAGMVARVTLTAVLLAVLTGCFGGDSDGPTLKLEADPTASYSDQQLDAVQDVLEQRLIVLGVDASVEKETSTTWTVQLPEEDQDVTAEELIAPGGAEFRQVLGAAAGADAEPSQPDAVVLPDETGEMFLELGRPEINSDQVERTEATYEPEQQIGWQITISFDGNGAAAWQRLTAAAACKTGDQQRIAILVGGKVVSSPTVQATPCENGIEGDTTQITGNFDKDEAEQLAHQIAFQPLAVSLQAAG